MTTRSLDNLYGNVSSIDNHYGNECIAQNYLENFSVDTLTEIFKKLTASISLMNASRTCKKFDLAIVSDTDLWVTKYFDFITNPLLFQKVPENIREICITRLLTPLSPFSCNSINFKFRAPKLLQAPFSAMLFNYKGAIRLLASCDLCMDSQYWGMKIQTCKINEVGLFRVSCHVNARSWLHSEKEYENRLINFDYNGRSQIHIGKTSLEVFPELTKSISEQVHDAGFSVIDRFQGNELWFKELSFENELNCESEPKVILVHIVNGILKNFYTTISENRRYSFGGAEPIKGSIVGYQNGKYLTSKNYEVYFEYRGSDRHEYTALWSKYLDEDN